MMEYKHLPVLLSEVVEGLKIKPNGIYFDGTLGGAGHTKEILKTLTGGRLIATDKDITAIKNAKQALLEYKKTLTLIHDDYKNIMIHMQEMGITGLDGILLDLGVSSHQIDVSERGFSYINDAPLDMRMDTTQEKSAFTVINTYSEKALSEIIFKYGEEKYSRRIAARIVNQRKNQPINTTLELARLIENCYPAKERFMRGNPAKKTFQAIRIEVNDELNGLYDYIYKMALFLNKNGRMCVISFHSLEDRIVKHCFRELERDCICDKRLPICQCDKRKEVEIITRKPILGKKEETINKRASSAKLRIIERI